MRIRARRYRLFPIFITIGIMFIKVKDFWHSDSQSDNVKLYQGDEQDSNLHYYSRHLMATDTNCTPAAIENFPTTLMSPEHRKHGGLVVHILVAAYMFWGLAIVCDEYFVPVCEKICDVLGLESDVAGATFMAGGSSAPELAVAVIGVFVAEDDIALGAIVGSAFFNILFVIAFCAIFAGTVVYLNWFPIFRDCSFYAVSILALVLTIYDGDVRWYEALSLMVLYVVYCLFMVVNKKVENFIVPKFSCCEYKSMSSGSTASEGEDMPVIGGATTKYSLTPADGAPSSSEDETAEIRVLLPSHNMLVDEQNVQLHETNGYVRSMDPDCTEIDGNILQ